MFLYGYFGLGGLWLYNRKWGFCDKCVLMGRIRKYNSDVDFLMVIFFYYKCFVVICIVLFDFRREKNNFV